MLNEQSRQKEHIKLLQDQIISLRSDIVFYKSEIVQKNDIISFFIKKDGNDAVNKSIKPITDHPKVLNEQAPKKELIEIIKVNMLNEQSRQKEQKEGSKRSLQDHIISLRSDIVFYKSEIVQKNDIISFFNKKDGNYAIKNN